jgi:hypothetical protein
MQQERHIIIKQNDGSFYHSANDNYPYFKFTESHFFKGNESNILQGTPEFEYIQNLIKSNKMPADGKIKDYTSGFAPFTVTIIPPKPNPLLVKIEELKYKIDELHQ